MDEEEEPARSVREHGKGGNLSQSRHLTLLLTVTHLCQPLLTFQVIPNQVQWCLLFLGRPIGFTLKSWTFSAFCWQIYQGLTLASAAAGVLYVVYSEVMDLLSCFCCSDEFFSEYFFCWCCPDVRHLFGVCTSHKVGRWCLVDVALGSDTCLMSVTLLSCAVSIGMACLP